MLFKINDTGALERVHSEWNPNESDLERYLITPVESNIPLMSESVFGESLLLVSNQVRTNTNQRADMLALDRAGNGVIIELKRHVGRLGVETQALQYLAAFSGYRGANFLRKFSSRVSEETLLRFFGDKAKIEDINLRGRVILVARSFDDAVLCLGEWLSSQGVAFRCISYTPVQIGGAKLLSFSVEFDRSPDGLYPLSFSSAGEPGIYWHNIAQPIPATPNRDQVYQQWWQFLVEHGQIPACFDDSPGDQGEKVLTKYVAGDKVVAYAAGYGAIGWGLIENPSTYCLFPPGHQDDFLNGRCRHRLEVTWKAIASQLSEGLPPGEVRREFNIFWPIATSVSMDRLQGEKLIARLSERFGAQPAVPRV